MSYSPCIVQHLIALTDPLYPIIDQKLESKQTYSEQDKDIILREQAISINQLLTVINVGLQGHRFPIPFDTTGLDEGLLLFFQDKATQEQQEQITAFKAWYKQIKNISNSS